MPDVTLPQMEEKIARCRLVFSGLVVLAVIVDPLQPSLNPWLTLMGSAYPLEPDFLGTLLLHFLYSSLAYLALRYRLTSLARLTWITISTDVLFAAALAFVTEGRSSLFYPFFTFVIVQSGVRWGLRRTLLVTGANVGLWLVMMLIWTPTGMLFYLMRPLYLVVVGYLVGYLGEQRQRLEADVQALAASDQRLRIARDLHDGCAQLLAALNLQLESCQNLLRAGQTSELLADLGELQRSVNSEHDDLRAYLRSLAGMTAVGSTPARSDPRIRIQLDLDASGALVDQVLRIVREGVTNVRRHAHAGAAVIHAATDDRHVTISIDDDGCGFAREGERPWSIVSRVAELGGSLEMARAEVPGAHLTISLPAA